MSEKKKKQKSVEDLFKEKLVRFYKQIIAPHVARLQSMRDLTEEERYSLRYRNFNPRILVLFDDAMTEIMKMIREGRKIEDEVIKNFFFKGRHAHITHGYCLQDDAKFDPDLRKNAFNSFFTSKSVALCYFGRTSNGFSSAEKKRAMAIIDEVFSSENEDRFCKLVYARKEKNKFQYVIAEEHEPFQMCASVVRQYLDQVTVKGTSFDVTNPFFAKFSANI